MIRWTLAQMRKSRKRLASAGVAIVIGTLFITVTFIAGNVMAQAEAATLAAKYGQADFVLTVPDQLTADDLDAIRGTTGVRAADPVRATTLAILHEGRDSYEYTLVNPSDPSLSPLVALAGRMPSAADEIALPVDSASALGVGIGDRVDTFWLEFADDTSETPTASMTVTALLADPRGAYAEQGGAATIDRSAFDLARTGLGWDPAATEAVVAIDPGNDPSTTQETLRRALPRASVETPAERSREVSSQLAHGQNVLVGVAFALAAVSLIVAALVIANTFQVLVAHRTRTLALLRAIGARRSQVMSSVLFEGALLGTVASIIGFTLGCIVSQAALSAAVASLDSSLPTSISISFATAAVPLALGITVTVVACAGPARAATRIAPMEALRPIESRQSQPSGRVRLTAFVVITLAGWGVMSAGVALGQSGSAEVGIGMLVVGIALSFTGLVFGGVYWLAPLIAISGRLIARWGTTCRLAVANTVRNPRRSATTSAALFIGATLVATMSTGAVSTRASIARTLDREFPADVSVEWFGGRDGEGISAQLAQDIGALPGVDGTAELRETNIVTDAGTFTILGGDVAALESTVRDPALLRDLATGAIAISPEDLERWNVIDGQNVTVTTSAGIQADLAVVQSPIGDFGSIVTTETLTALVPDPTALPVTVLLARIDTAQAAPVVSSIQETVVQSEAPINVTGSIAERTRIDRLINAILAITLGLLAAAVIVAVIGVANTLSLSVVERRRESATLRAIGLSKKRLRRMLAIEGMLLSGVGALCGAVLGTFYGWAGSTAAFSAIDDVTLAVPWIDLGVLLFVALGAGWLASVVPARAATRVSPVSTLTID